VESSKFGNAIAALITIIIISPFLWALALRRVAVKEVEILRQERKYRGPIMMMVLFRIGLATFYIGFLLNIFSLRWSLSALILAVSVYIFSQRNYTVNTLELKIIFFKFQQSGNSK
jgi:CPA2 family monovalent cation:H+ antiporter-2